MLHLAKYLFYTLLIIAVGFGIWFLPKYSYVKDNPGYCVALTNNLYYCGDESNLDTVFETTAEDAFQQAIEEQNLNDETPFNSN